MKIGITIGLGLIGAIFGYVFSLMNWSKIQETGLAFVVSFVVSYGLLVAYNGAVSEGTESRSPKFFDNTQHILACVVSGIIAVIAVYILK